MKQRQEIEEKYKWDLSGYFKSDEDWDNQFEQIKSEYESLIVYENKLTNNDLLFECLEKNRKLGEIVERLYVYINLRVKEDATVSIYKSRANKLDKFLSDINPKLSFISSEMADFSDEKIEELLNDKRFDVYDLSLKDIKRQRPHKLNKNEEKLVSTISECVGGEQELFDMISDVDMKFDDIKDKDGNLHPLNHSTYITYLESDDAVLRENAYNGLNGGFGGLNYALSINYLNNVKSDCVFAKIRKFNSAFESSLFYEEVPKEVYTTLLQEVSNNLPLFYKYFALKKEVLNLDKIKNCDMNVAMKLENKKKYTFDEAFEIVKQALSVLGKDYIDILQKSKDERWIDVMPNKNKDNGAFSWGAYGANPVVLLNFDGTVNSVFTLAHELGHMMHSYYSDKNNPSTKAQYELFVAEVASITNEILLAKHLLKKSKTNEEKLFYIDHILNLFYATIHRQTMFSEFEYKIHKAYEDGEDVSTEAMNNVYSKLCQKYFGEEVEICKNAKYEWSRIPHFYRSFYVYKYATGLISAFAISNYILSEKETAVNSYKKFLSSGCNKPPVDLLKITNVDLTNKNTFNSAFNYVDSLLKEFECILQNSVKTM